VTARFAPGRLPGASRIVWRLGAGEGRDLSCRLVRPGLGWNVVRLRARECSALSFAVLRLGLGWNVVRLDAGGWGCRLIDLRPKGVESSKTFIRFS
jgi:hypothetical protein